MQGEPVKTHGAYANGQFIKILGLNIDVCGIASEKDQKIISFDNPVSREDKYVICLKPLGGLSNMDVNVSIRINFPFYRKKSVP